MTRHFSQSLIHTHEIVNLGKHWETMETTQNSIDPGK